MAKGNAILRLRVSIPDIENIFRLGSFLYSSSLMIRWQQGNVIGSLFWEVSSLPFKAGLSRFSFCPKADDAKISCETGAFMIE